MTTWTFPPAGGQARGVSVQPWLAGGVLVPDWFAPPRAWPFSSTGVGSAPIVLGPGTGLVGGGIDSNGTAWFVGHGGPLWSITSAGVVSSINLPKNAYVGCVVIGLQVFVLTASGFVYSATSGVPILTDSSGNSILLDGSAGTYIAMDGVFNLLGNFGVPANLLATQGSGNLLALLPSVLAVGIMNASSGATNRVSLPAALPYPTLFKYTSGAGFAAAGWSPAFLPLGQDDMALNPVDPLSMAGIGNGVLTLWRAPTALSDAWAQVAQLTGIPTDASQIAWSSDGTQILISCPISSQIVIVNYFAGVLSARQIVTATDPVSVTAFAGGAFSCTPSSGGYVAVLAQNFDAWNISYFVYVPGAANAVIINPTTALVAGTNGATFLTLNGAQWVATPIAGSGSAATQVAVDTDGLLYVASNGTLTQMSSTGTVLQTATWTGSCAALIAYRKQILVVDATYNMLRVFGCVEGSTALMQTATYPLTNAPKFLSMAQRTIFSGSAANGTPLFAFSAPFTAPPVKSGVVSIWNGTAWTSLALGLGRVPSSMAVAADGNIAVTTFQNELLTVSASGALIGASPIADYTGQLPGVSLGIGAMLQVGSTLFGTSPLSGGLVQLPAP